MENYNIPKEISTELKINKSLYLFDLLFIIGLLMVTMMSYTKTYEAVSSNITGTVTIENRVYHPATNSLDMVIKMDQTDEEEVSFLAQEKANPNIKLPVHLLYEDDGYYVVRVSELSPNWEALAFDLYQENEEKETVNVDDVTRDSETDSTEEIDAHALITTLYSDQWKTKSEEGKGIKTKQEYALLVNDLEKQFVKKKMKNYENAITVEAKHKRQTQQEMNELQRDMKYQVEEEKADTESKIAMKKDAIQSSDESIQLYEDEQKSLQEKLKKLNEKQQDLAMKWKNSWGRWGDIYEFEGALRGLMANFLKRLRGRWRVG